MRRATERVLLPALAVLMVGAALVFGTGSARAQQIAPPLVPHNSAIITNGVITLGINDQGHLNIAGPPSCSGTSAVGLRFNVTGCEFTAPGCLCEGWGAADATSGVTGYANVSTDGVVNLALLGFSSTASTALSRTQIRTASGAPVLEVTHNYHPSLGAPELPPFRPGSANLYVDVVTITNVSAAPVDLRYRRVMDWDMEPTAFSEFVTIQHFGATPPTNLLDDNDDGFATANPLGSNGGILFGAGLNFFTDSGPADHGARFDFGFGSLAPGASRTFNTYYGATATEAEANTAIAAVGAELWSFGQCNPSFNATCNITTGTPNTAIFAFGGVGGTAPPPPGDTTKPICTLKNSFLGPPKGINISTQDPGSGLATIVVTSSVNMNVVIPPFVPGTTAEVVVTASKMNNTLSASVTLRVTDVAGNVTDCDPVLHTAIREDGKPVAETFTDVPQAESKVTITNGTPGVRNLELNVNGKTFKVNGLKDGATAKLDVASAMQPGNTNTITVTAHGKPGASALVVIADV